MDSLPLTLLVGIFNNCSTDTYLSCARVSHRWYQTMTQLRPVINQRLTILPIPRVIDITLREALAVMSEDAQIGPQCRQYNHTDVSFMSGNLLHGASGECLTAKYHLRKYDKVQINKNGYPMCYSFLYLDDSSTISYAGLCHDTPRMVHYFKEVPWLHYPEGGLCDVTRYAGKTLSVVINSDEQGPRQTARVSFRYRGVDHHFALEFSLTIATEELIDFMHHHYLIITNHRNIASCLMEDGIAKC